MDLFSYFNDASGCVMFIGYDLGNIKIWILSILVKIEFGKIIWNPIRTQQFAICLGSYWTGRQDSSTC